jgi:hypothetical protein
MTRTLWAYQTTYKLLIYIITPFELVYSTQLVMPTEFMVPTKRIRDVPTKDLNKAIHVKMENFIRLD